LLELANAMSGKVGRNLAAKLFDRIASNPEITVIAADASAFQAGLALYKSMTDKEWSLTDCISFSLMREHDLNEALTADHHFQQAGFVALLKDPTP
jgi:predicted nucleic acid-binding protein